MVKSEDESYIYRESSRIKPYEYLCRDCKQLRLAFGYINCCGNCGSTRIIKGELGELKKE